MDEKLRKEPFRVLAHSIVIQKVWPVSQVCISEETEVVLTGSPLQIFFFFVCYIKKTVIFSSEACCDFKRNADQVVTSF